MMGFQKTAPILKWEKQDDGGLRFWGCFSSETPDSQGDIVLQKATKQAVAGWRAKNIREMHKRDEAVGKAIEFEFRPDGTSHLVGRVTAGAPMTVKKVQDDVLSMMSIAGPAPTKVSKRTINGKDYRVIEEYALTEISLVDNGSNPDAWISVAKAAGIEPEEDEEEKPPIEGEGEKPAVDPAESAEDEQSPKEKSEEPVQLSEAQMVELVTKITDAVLAAIEAKKADDPATTPAPTPEQKPAEKSADATGIRKDEEADVLCAASILDSLKNLRVSEGSEPEIETKQIAALARAASALAEFIALEAGEVVMNAEAPMPEPAALELAAKIDGLAKAVADMAEAFGAIQKSAPPPDPRLDDVVAGIGSISKTVSDLQAGGESHAGEIKALRKGMDQILSMPVPGRSPVRNFEALRGQIEKSAPSETSKANALRSAAQGAPPAVRDYLLNEAAAIERS